MYVTKPYEFIGFGAMDATKPYKFIGFGAMEVTGSDLGGAGSRVYPKSRGRPAETAQHAAFSGTRKRELHRREPKDKSPN